MFKFFKEKLRGALKKFSDELEEEAEVLEEAEQTTAEEESEETTADEARETSVKEEIEEVKPSSKEEDLGSEERVEGKREAEVEEKAEESNVGEATKDTILKEEAKESSSEETEETIGKKGVKEEVEEKLEEVKEEVDSSNDDISEEKDDEKNKKGFFKKLFKHRKEESESSSSKSIDDSKAEEPFVKEKTPSSEEQDSKKETIFTKIRKTRLSEDKFEELFWDLELVLLENNVAVEVIDKIKSDLKEALVGEKAVKKEMVDLIAETLRKSIMDILTTSKLDLLSLAREKKQNNEPLIIALIGVNGSGKTTTLAKLANYFKKNGFSVVVAAADTFRAAAIQQLEEHTNNLGVKLIKHDYNADPAAVAFDAVKHARSKNINVVLIDSAGRLHSNDNLMNELKKIIRVNNPDVKIFVGEAITGNDCVEQARLFDEAVGIDAIILAKADVDEKGGAALSVSFVTKKPIIFLGTGQGYDDLEEFDPDKIIRNLGL